MGDLVANFSLVSATEFQYRCDIAEGTEKHLRNKTG